MPAQWPSNRQFSGLGRSQERQSARLRGALPLGTMSREWCPSIGQVELSTFPPLSTVSRSDGLARLRRGKLGKTISLRLTERVSSETLIFIDSKRMGSIWG